MDFEHSPKVKALQQRFAAFMAQFRDRAGPARPGSHPVSDHCWLARADASPRTLRFAEGPDEVHRHAIAKGELARYADER